MTGIPQPVRRAGRWALRASPVRAAAVRAAAKRGHRLVMVYHRVNPDDAQALGGVVPSVPRRLFRQQLEVLAEVGTIVPLERLLDEGDQRRPRFALTFDDDYASHAAQALPVLEEARAVATFFLSGRSLHGLGPYWFESLDKLLADKGLEGARRVLAVPEATTVDDLAVACERSRRLQQAAVAAVDLAPSHLQRDQMARLAGAGMTVGFHTLHHPLLTGLDRTALQRALTDGRDLVQDAVGRPIALLAYPHGKADRRVADAARAAGYRMAWTGSPRPVRPADDRFLLGRWEPGRLEVDDFAAALAVRLHRAAPPG
jgi:peptidoglycan/xylan/chitin deacetylase (PgdA/CDA1 family)